MRRSVRFPIDYMRVVMRMRSVRSSSGHGNAKEVNNASVPS